MAKRKPRPPKIPGKGTHFPPLPGERPGGRQIGAKNKIVSEIKLIAQQYGEESILKLATLMRESKDEDTQLRAADLLLQRGYGRPTIEINLSVKRGIDDFSDDELTILADAFEEHADTDATAPLLLDLPVTGLKQ